MIEIEKERKKRVYVAGVYSITKTGEKAGVLDVLKNIGAGEAMCAELFSIGWAPFCPWHDAQYAKYLYDSYFPVSYFYELSLAWLEVSDCMLVISGKGLGSGVDMEIQFCKDHNIPVFYSVEELNAWRESLYEISAN